MTEPMHRHVREVGPESRLAFKERSKRRGQVRRDRFDSVATIADEVDVRFVLDRVVGRWPMTDVRMRHQPHGLEDVDRAIHGREIDAACRALDFGEDLIRGGVVKRGDGLQDELALRRDPISVCPEHPVPCVSRDRHLLDSRSLESS